MYILRYLACVLFLSVQLFGTEGPSVGETVLIPMRDGTKLSTDLYFPPEGNPENHPCVILRSPSGRKNPHAVHFAALTYCGYVIAIQDTRSAMDPEGKTFPYLTDGWGKEQDGYDTIEWLANSPYCNGKIGSAGVSALGISQLLLAPTAPPSLKCQYIGVAASSLYHHALFPGGQILKNQAEGWLGAYARDCGVHCYANTRMFYDEFWENFNTLSVADRIKTPAVHYGGWYDTFLQGTIDAFVSRQYQGGQGAKGQQKLIIGPWTHFFPERTTLGDFDVPKEGMQAPVDYSITRWFDYHLKGIDNGIQDIPNVIYYVMGPFDGTPSSGNVWRYTDDWPVPHVMTALYLAPNGKLVENTQPQKSQSFSFEYHPHNPVPTLGGRNLFLESGPKDQREIEQRDDVLVFTSDPLTEDIEVTGQVIAKLFFSSNQKDTDVVVRLTDVYPDGRSILITDGIHRTGNSAILAEDYKHDEPTEVEIDMWSTSLVFAKGHRIRLSITSSNYPKYERNFNVGLIGSYSGDYSIAKNNIHVGEPHLSQLILPVVRGSISK